MAHPSQQTTRACPVLDRAPRRDDVTALPLLELAA